MANKYILAGVGTAQFYTLGYKNLIGSSKTLTESGISFTVTEEEIRSRTKSDPHSLGRWRVNGTLPHIDMWYDAFGVKEGDKMYIPKEKRLALW